MNRRSVLQFLGLTPLAGPLIGKEAVANALSKEALAASSVVMTSGKSPVAAPVKAVIKGKLTNQPMAKRSRLVGYLTGKLHDVDQLQLDQHFVGWKKQHQKSSVEDFKSVSPAYKRLKQQELIVGLMIQQSFLIQSHNIAYDDISDLPFRDSKATEYKPHKFSKWLAKRMLSDQN